VKSTVITLTRPLQDDQQAVRAVRRRLVQAPPGFRLVMQELPECRVAEGRVVAGMQQELVPHVIGQRRRMLEMHPPTHVGRNS
jgi:hypothetical protein